MGMLIWPFSKIIFLEASEIMRDIGTAIQYLHAMNIAHRDVKVRFDSALEKKKKNWIMKVNETDVAYYIGHKQTTLILNCAKENHHA